MEERTTKRVGREFLEGKEPIAKGYKILIGIGAAITAVIAMRTKAEM